MNASRRSLGLQMGKWVSMTRSERCERSSGLSRNASGCHGLEKY